MRLLLLAALVVAYAALPAAQTPLDSSAVEPLDGRLFRVVYAQDQPAFVGAMRAAEASSLPIMFGTVPVVWGATLATGSDIDPAVRLTVAEGGAFAIVLALKNIVARPRPYRALRDVQARTRRHSQDEVLDPHSFPSGHAALSFALATSASLTSREWYVVAPAMTWATAIALARVWHGVHYPLDITTGAVIGAGSAALVHVLLPDISAGGDGDVTPLFAVRIPL